MIYVAFYVGKGKLFNRIIRAWQWLKGDKYWKASHTELLREYDAATNTYKAYSSSAMDGGVRIKNIRLDDGKWILMPADQEKAENADRWMLKNLGAKYDWCGIGSQIDSDIKEDKDKYYCNESVQEMLGIVGKHRPATLLYALKNAPITE